MKHIKPYFECKYPILHSNELKLLEILKPISSPDENGNNGEYFVSSIYFDSPDLDFYHDKIEGEYYKIKIRLRFYKKIHSNIWKDPKLELKMRIGDMVTKFSQLISIKEANNFRKHGISAMSILNVLKKMPEQQSLVYKLFKDFFYPTAKIIYRRKAIGFSFLPSLRVTIDKHIEAKTSKNCRCKLISSRDLFINPSPIILEIKSNTTIPSFLLDNFEKLGISQKSISKYALAINSILHDY